jgi:hypothetical protein
MRRDVGNWDAVFGTWAAASPRPPTRLSHWSLVVRHANKVAARAELIELVRLVGFDD